MLEDVLLLASSARAGKHPHRLAVAV